VRWTGLRVNPQPRGGHPALRAHARPRRPVSPRRNASALAPAHEPIDARRAAAKLAGDRGGRPPEPAGDLAHPMTLNGQKRDLLTFDEAKVSARRQLCRGREMRWRHAAGFPQPPGSHGRRYPGIHGGIFARTPRRDRRPERASVFAPSNGWPARRAQRLPRGSAERRFPFVLATSFVRVLRRPVESAQAANVRISESLRTAGAPRPTSPAARHAGIRKPSLE
jgi:hypothetical protein